jgi:hypothetical protein
MTTATIEKPAAAVTKSDKVKAKEGKAARAALDAMQGNVAAAPKKNGTAPVAGVSKVEVKAAIAANAEVIKTKATVVPPLDKVTEKKAKAAPVNTKAVKLGSKELSEHPAARENAASWDKATVKAKKEKAEPKAPKERKERKVSAMQVIRRTLAHNHNATVEEISKACAAAGVPKSEGTILTIRSDFMQTYAALVEAGCISGIKSN